MARAIFASSMGIGRVSVLRILTKVRARDSKDTKVEDSRPRAKAKARRTSSLPPPQANGMEIGHKSNGRETAMADGHSNQVVQCLCRQLSGKMSARIS